MRDRPVAISWSLRTLVTVVTLGILALVWLPYGFGMLGLIEEWGIVGTFTRNHHITFIAVEGGPFGATRMRPLDILPFAIAYLVSPESFRPWHLLMAGSLFGKAAGMGSLLYWLVRDRAVAVIGAALFILYPADTMQMTLRALHINCSVALTVGGIATFLWSTESPLRGRRILLSGLAAIQFVTGILIYEAGGLLIVMPLLLWWCRYGVGPGSRMLPAHWPEGLLWGGGCALLLSNIAMTGAQQDVYQATISNAPGQTLAAVAHRWPLLFEVGMYRTLAHGWYDGFRMLAANIGDLYLYFAVFLCGAIFVVSKLPIAAGRTVAFELRWLSVGLVAAVLGYLPYLTSLSHILITQRTYLFAAVGGAIFFTALLGLLAKMSRQMAGVATIALLSAGLGSQWEQLRHYTNLSARQRTILSGIVTVAPHPPAGSNLLITDNSGQLNSDWFLRDQLLDDALTYLYGYSVSASICQSPSEIWASFSQDSRGVPGHCRDDGDQWTIGVGLPTQHVVKKAGSTQLIIDPLGNVSNKENVHNAATQVQADRWSRVLGCWPETKCSTSLPPMKPSFVYDFGRYWSLEEAPWGAGWRDAWWNPPAWQPISYSWMDAAQSRLWFELAPTRSNYEFRVALPFAFTQPQLGGTVIEINDHKLNVIWKDAAVGTAPVPGDWLNRGLNKVDFRTELDQNSGLGLAVDKVEIRPQAP